MLTDKEAKELEESRVLAAFTAWQISPWENKETFGKRLKSLGLQKENKVSFSEAQRKKEIYEAYKNAERIKQKLKQGNK